VAVVVVVEVVGIVDWEQSGDATLERAAARQRPAARRPRPRSLRALRVALALGEVTGGVAVRAEAREVHAVDVGRAGSRGRPVRARAALARMIARRRRRLAIREGVQRVLGELVDRGGPD